MVLILPFTLKFGSRSLLTFYQKALCEWSLTILTKFDKFGKGIRNILMTKDVGQTYHYRAPTGWFDL